MTDIARLTDIPKSTVHRLTTTLVEEAFLREDDGGRLRIGRGLQRLLGVYLATSSKTQRYKRLLSGIVTRFGETAFLAKFDGDTVSIVEVLAPSDAYRSHVYPGLGARPLSTCSSSRAILAFQGAPERLRLLGAEFQEGLDEVRRQGFAICDGEIDVGVFSVAVPVLVPPMEPFLSIGLSGPEARFRGKRMEEMLPALTAAAATIGNCVIDENTNWLSQQAVLAGSNE